MYTVDIGEYGNNCTCTVLPVTGGKGPSVRCSAYPFSHSKTSLHSIVVIKHVSGLGDLALLALLVRVRLFR